MDNICHHFQKNKIKDIDKLSIRGYNQNTVRIYKENHHMKLGIRYNMYLETFSCYGDEKFKKIKSFGFDCVDVGLGNTNVSVYTLPEDEAEKILVKERNLAKDADIEICQVHGPWCWPPPETDEEGKKKRMEEMKRSIRATKTLGCKFWVVHPIMPYLTEDLGTDKEKLTWQENLDFMRELLSCAKENGVTICLENMPMPQFSIATPQQILNFVKEIDDENFKICLDVGHVAVFENLSVQEEIRRLGKEIKTLHIHDNDVGPDMHLLPYDGRIEWNEVSEALKSIGYDGVFSVELNVPSKAPRHIRESWLKLIAEIAEHIAK